MISKVANVPNQNPFADTLHNRLVFLVLYFDLPPQDADLSASYLRLTLDFVPYSMFGLHYKKYYLIVSFIQNLLVRHYLSMETHSLQYFKPFSSYYAGLWI